MVLGHVKSIEVSVTVGTTEITPVPVSGMVCGLPAELSVIVKVPVYGAALVGVKTAWNEHPFPADKPVQLSAVTVKGPGVTVKELIE